MPHLETRAQVKTYIRARVKVEGRIDDVGHGLRSYFERIKVRRKWAMIVAGFQVLAGGPASDITHQILCEWSVLTFVDRDFRKTPLIILRMSSTKSDVLIRFQSSLKRHKPLSNGSSAHFVWQGGDGKILVLLAAATVCRQEGLEVRAKDLSWGTCLLHEGKKPQSCVFIVHSISLEGEEEYEQEVPVSRISSHNKIHELHGEDIKK